MATHPAGTPWFRPPPSASPAVPTSSEPAGCFGFDPPKAAPKGGNATELVEPRASCRGPYCGGYNVSSCEAACAGWPAFGLLCGGFCSNDRHDRARCICAREGVLRRPQEVGGKARGARGGIHNKLPAPRCASVCSLFDDRACGGHKAIAVYWRG